jgi:flagellar basal-body rod protein FlgG
LANGATAYTRDGEFQVSAQGQLLTKQGYAVLGQNGPIQLDRNNRAPLSISATGEISQGPEVKGRLKVVNIDRPNLLTQISGGYFLADNPTLQPAPISQPSVRQGFLEAANTSSMLEMANLIRSMRSFEANQRIIQMQDERMGQAISDLGSPN